jgi:signal peptidase II
MKQATIYTILTFSTVALCLDRLTKILVRQKLLAQPGVFIFKSDFLTLRFIFSLNENLSFSIYLPKILIYILTLTILIALSWLLKNQIKKNALATSIFLTLIIASAAGNLYDRIVYGGVIDFISLKIFHFQWAIFNLADIFITFGVIGLLILELRKSNQSSAISH